LGECRRRFAVNNAFYSEDIRASVARLCRHKEDCAQTARSFARKLIPVTAFEPAKMKPN